VTAFGPIGYTLPAQNQLLLAVIVDRDRPLRRQPRVGLLAAADLAAPERDVVFPLAPNGTVQRLGYRVGYRRGIPLSIRGAMGDDGMPQ